MGQYLVRGHVRDLWFEALQIRHCRGAGLILVCFLYTIVPAFVALYVLPTMFF